MYAANVIRRYYLDMIVDHRDTRMSIRWACMNAGLPDPVFVCNFGWRWVRESDAFLSLLDEFVILGEWELAGRHVPPYVHVAVTVAGVHASYKRQVHYREFHALRRLTKRARRRLPRSWV